MTPAERMKARGKVVDGFIRTAALPHARAVRDYILKLEEELAAAIERAEDAEHDAAIERAGGG